MKYLQKIFSILLITGMLIGFVQAGTVKANNLSATPSAEKNDKIETQLLDQFSAEGAADFIVEYNQQADLSAAYQMSWEDRGWYVYNTLIQFAETSQTDTKAILDKFDLSYETFFSGNELYVHAGSLTAAQEVAYLPEVMMIRTPRTYYIDPVLETPTTLLSVSWAGDLLANDISFDVTTDATTDWGITDTKADQFWSTFGSQGDGMVVANIDTGVQWNHPALDQAFKCGTDPTNPDCWRDPSNICGSGGACDNNGHGTHTMGTMVGDDDPSLQYIVGMAPNAQWIACKGCETNSCSETALNACADWIVAPDGDPNNRPDVVNNSWGGGGGDPWYQAKVDAWRAAGIFPAFSAGNSGPSCSTLGSPGDYQQSFGSAAHDSSRTIASFSSRGPSTYGHDPYTKPNISSPGVNVCSSIPGNSWSCTYSGTSMASPHSAGAVALLWSCNPSLKGNIDATFQILQSTANTPPAGSCGAPPDGEGNYTYGYGYLDTLAMGLQNCVSDWGAIDGHAYNAVTNAAIEGVNVTGARQGGGTWSDDTDVTGYYTMTVGAGTYDMTAAHPMYSTGVVNNLVVPTDTVITQDFYLQPRGHLYGYVTDLNSGVPLAGTVSVAGGPSTPTNPTTGFYEFYLDPGTYDVTASAPDYADATASVVLAIGSQLQQDFALLAAIAVVPDPIAITLELGQTGTVESQMTNNMAVDYPFQFIELPLGMNLAASGGPDPFGYTFADSNETGGPTYEWIDATDGTALGLTDDGEANVTLPFSFDFYGTSSAAIRVGNNGGVIFNATIGDLSTANADLGTTTATNLLVPFWDDIDSDTGDVYFKTVGSAPYRIVVIEWFNRPHYSNVGNATFELILYETTNNIKFQYQDVVFGNTSYDYGASATVGIRQSGTNYLQYSYNQPVIQDNMSICFTYPGSAPCDGGDISWYATSITQGTLPAGSTLGWTNTFSATTAAGIGQPGVYNSLLRVLPTAPELPSKTVNLEMTVLPTASFGELQGTVTSDRPGGPLEAEIIIEATDGTTVTVTTDPLTGFYSWWLEQGSYDLTVSSPGYITHLDSAVIVGGQVTIADFELSLDQPQIIVTPAELAQTLTFGGSATQTLNIANVGFEPLNWELREANAGAILVNDILLMADDVIAADWDIYRAALTAAGVTWDEWNLDTLPFPTAAELAPYTLLIWADENTLIPDNSECQIVADWLNSGGKALFANGVDFLWDIANGTPGSGENNLYVLFNTTYQGDYAGTAITRLNGVAGDPIGGDFVDPNGLVLAANSDSNGDYANLSSAATTGLIYGAGGSGSGYAGLTHYEGANYKIAWLGVNFHNGLTDAAQRDILMINVLTFLGGGGDVPWLSESPTSGTLQPGQDVNVTVTFDSSMVPEPGVYQAVLRTMSNDPFNGIVDVPVTMTVNPSTAIGKLEGTVTSDRPGGPLEAEVLIEGSVISYTVPTDPATGFYYKWLDAGQYDVTASAAGYIPQSVSVSIVGTITTTQDFELELMAPEIAIDPTSLEQSLEMGQVATQDLDISNLGNEPLTFEVTERNGGFTPGTEGEDILVVAHDSSAAAAMETALTSLGYTYLQVSDAQFQAMTVDQLLGYMAVFHAGTTGLSGNPSASEVLLMAYLDAGGSLFISDNDLGFYRHDSVFYETYLQSTYNLDNAGDFLDGLDIMAGLTLDVSDDPYPDGITVGAEGTPIFQFQGSSDQGGVALARNSYRAIYTAFDYHRLTDPTNSVEVINRVLDFIAVSEVPWLTEDPISGTIPAGDTLPIQVTFDAGVASQPGTYTADLRISHNDPLAGPIIVPVTLTVTPSADYGLLNGVIMGLGYCDADPAPLEAEVLIEAGDGSTWTVTSDPITGEYFHWLLGGTYTVTASADGHLPATAVVEVIPEQTITQDLDLRFIESCMDVTPTEYILTMPVNTQQTELLTIDNSGAGELIWESHETTRTIGLEAVHVPRFTGTLPDDKNPVSFERAPQAAPSEPAVGTPIINVGAPAFAMDLFDDSLYYMPDLEAPGTWTFISTPGITSAYAGDFGPDTETLYLVSDDTQTLYAVDVATGAAIAIGPSSVSPKTWTGMAWDPTTQAMYGVATDGATANLYTVNLQTGELTFVAVVANASYTIDIAVDSAGQMYGVDLVQDALMTIDKTTGATSVIGSIGFNANYAQGMDYDLENNILYLAGYNGTTNTGGLYILDTATGAAMLVGTFPGGDEVDALAVEAGGIPPWNDVPWVSEDPITGTVAPDSSTEVAVTFDTTSLAVGECYTASLGLVHDDPGWDSPSYIPLNLCVVEQIRGVDLEPESSADSGAPGEEIVYTLGLSNTGNVADTFDLSFSNVDPGWTVVLPVLSFELAAGEAVDVTVLVTIPADAANGDFDTFTVTATSTTVPTVTDDVEITTTAVVGKFNVWLPLVNKE